MSLVQRTTSTRKPSSVNLCSTQETTRNGTGSASSSKPLSQAKLDRLCKPTATYHHSYFRWFTRLSLQRDRYPAREMKTQLQDVTGPEVCRLQWEVRHPPETMTAAEWEALEDRLRKLEGQMDALAAVLEMRAKEQPQAPSRRLNLRAAPSPATTSPDPSDPFAGEE
jgi:hypothetical protein